MEVILDKEKLRGCREYGLGVLITLKQTLSTSEVPHTLVVVGQCACVKANKVSRELDSFNLPTPNWTETVDFAKGHFPGGCDVGVGVWVSVETGNEKSIENIWEILVSKTDVLDVLNPSVLVALVSSGENGVECFKIGSDSSNLDRQSVTLTDSSVIEYLNENTVPVRLLASLPLYIPQDQTAISAISSIEELIKDPSTVFYLPSKPLVFSETTSLSTTVKNTLGNKIKQKEKRSTRVHPTPASIEFITDNSHKANHPCLSLTTPLSTACMRVSIPIDVLGLFRSDCPLSDVAAILKDKAIDHLRIIAQGLAWKEGAVCDASVHHIPIINQHCQVTVIYPHTAHLWEEPGKTTPIKTDKLRPYREELHDMFCLGNKMPHLRVPKTVEGPQLLNPHLNVKNQSKDGQLAVVQGNYLYYHYMQSGFNDDGWGCAYRSLQTLWSWFLLQGYTDMLPPSHREIQEALVTAGDKQPSLVGSKEWIGSYEVSTCLNQLLQVTSKIHHCNSGSNMASVGRVLLEHFRTQGTPVMIGGGVLAHTILGINFNEMTGDALFLILDPHYTGREDIKTITEKGKWCGWKPVSFWDPNAHYNLCMPQRPVNVI